MEDAAEAVPARYFQAVEAHDCNLLKRLTTGSLAKDLETNGCDQIVREIKEHQVKFLGTAGDKADGRDPNARLVTIRLTMQNAPRTFSVRVQNVEGSWKLATM